MAIEYTPSEIAQNGNQMYGGKRHDEICDRFQKNFNLNESQVNDVSMGVWEGIKSEREVTQEKLKDIQKLVNQLLENGGNVFSVISKIQTRLQNFYQE